MRRPPNAVRGKTHAPLTPDEAEFQQWKRRQSADVTPAQSATLADTMRRTVGAPRAASASVGVAPSDAIARVPDQEDFEAWKAQHPSLASRVGSLLFDATTAPARSAITATVAPSVGESRVNSSSVAVPQGNGTVAIRNNRTGIVTKVPANATTYDAAHGGVTSGQRAIGALQTAANIVAPSIAKIPYAGLPLAGATTGAAYNPEHPLIGAGTGALVGTVLAGAPAAGGKFLDLTGLRPTTYAETPTFLNALADAAERVTPASATRDINIPPTSGPGIVRSVARAAGVQSVEQRALSKISEAMERDGLSLEQAVQKAATETGMAPNTLMELAGQNTMRLGRAARTAPGRGSEIMGTRLDQRALGEEETMTQHLLGATGGDRTNIPATKTALAQQAKTAAQPLYDKLRALPPADMNAAAEYFDRPAFKAAYEHARKVAANDGKTLPDLFEDVTDASGKVVGQRLRPMDFQTVDRVKRALDDVLYDSERPLPSELASKAGGLGNEGRRVIEHAKNDFLSVADRAFPGYAEARNAFAGPTALNRAATKGEQILTMSPSDVQEYLGTLSDSERQMFRRSAIETIIDRRLESAAPGSNPTRFVFDKTRDKKRLALLFENPDDLTAFGQRAAEMSRRFRTRNFVGQQSATADKLAELADLAGLSVDDLAHLATGDVTGAAKKLAMKLVGKGQQGMTEATGEAVANRLTAGATPEAPNIMDVLNELLANERNRGIQRIRRGVKATAAGTVGGQTTRTMTQP